MNIFCIAIDFVSLHDVCLHSQCVYMNFNQISPMVTQFNCRVKMLPKCLYFTINHMLSCGNRLILQLFCVSLSFWWTGCNDLNTRMQRSVIISSHPAAQLLLLFLGGVAGVGAGLGINLCG